MHLQDVKKWDSINLVSLWRASFLPMMDISCPPSQSRLSSTFWSRLLACIFLSFLVLDQAVLLKHIFLFFSSTYHTLADVKESLEAQKLDFFLAETNLEGMFQMCTSTQLLKGIQSMILQLHKNESISDHCDIGVTSSSGLILQSHSC